jgi:hypothetical protein
VDDRPWSHNVTKFVESKGFLWDIDFDQDGQRRRVGELGCRLHARRPAPLTVRIVGLDREVRLHLGVAPVAARA